MAPSLSLEGKNAIVTGGSRGIGSEIAQELARRGASVLITYVSSKAGADKTLAAISSVAAKAAKTSAVQADCAKATEAAETIVAEVNRVFGGAIDIIVNNAAYGFDASLAEVTQENFDQVFHTNVLFPMILVQHCRPSLRKNARIVNISSTAARAAYTSAITYAASKAALESITKTLAVELGRELNATVNAVNPGPIRTDMWNDTPGADEAERQIFPRTAAGDRIGEVNDVAPIVAFLCEEQSRWVTGSVTCANGGYVFV